MEKTILCFGDSNTWGHNPVDGKRFGWDVRWPGVLAGLLGSDYHVVEEGLGGRTTAFNDPIEPFRNGRKVAGRAPAYPQAHRSVCGHAGHQRHRRFMA